MAGGGRREGDGKGRGIVGWRFSGSSVGGDRGCTRGSVGCLLLLESGRRAHTTDTIAAINTGEQPLTSPTGGPILYFISKLIPHEQIYCKKGVKKYIFSAHGPPARPSRPCSACHPIHLSYRANAKVLNAEVKKLARDNVGFVF